MMNAALRSSVVGRLLLLAGCSIVAVSAADAQTPAAEAPAAAADPADAMADIIVVARRSEERLQSVPLSITAVSGTQ
ncbi:MAG: hypothetical protein JWR77_1281, partial [Rhizorhabdus sp.]|nr:hypothetical protein [Rhizorhabdus sp.]